MTIEEVKGFDAFLWRFCRAFFAKSEKVHKKLASGGKMLYLCRRKHRGMEQR